MPDATFGRYMRLLFRQWIEGSVPADAAVAVRVGMLDPDSVGDVQSLLDRKFSHIDAKRRMNPRCAAERETAVNKVLTNKANGSLGGRIVRSSKRSSKRKAKGSIRASGSVSGSGFPSGSGPENPEQAGRSKAICTSEQAERMYAIYPRHVGKGAALPAIQRAAERLASTGDLTPVETLTEAVTAYRDSPKVKTTQRKFIPNPTTWFNQARYADDRSEWQEIESNSAPKRRSIAEIEAGE